MYAIENIHVGDIITHIFIFFVLVTMIVVVIRVLIMMFAKNKQPSTQNNPSHLQQIHELTMRIQKLEQQIEELQKKSL
ncbi:hypothetical protein ACIQ2D_07655 [Lysinibacillus sp. NPDC097287]|uniref:hypothetical protein n=1 Tax=Lysinibacillus sp. NPDC097287 TaxID=3364144 RepID=UPI003807F89E